MLHTFLYGKSKSFFPFSFAFLPRLLLSYHIHKSRVFPQVLIFIKEFFVASGIDVVRLDLELQPGFYGLLFFFKGMGKFERCFVGKDL